MTVQDASAPASALPAGPTPPSEWPDLLTLAREDVRTNMRSWTRPGPQALLAYRLEHWARHRRPTAPGAPLGRLIGALLRRIVRRRFDVDVSPHARLGRKVGIGHQGGIVIDGTAVIGDRSVVRQQVRIGCFTRGPGADGVGPRLGRNVDLGARCVIDGPVRIGDDVRIGANAVVTMDVPDGATVMAPPSKVVRAAEAELPKPAERIAATS